MGTMVKMVTPYRATVRRVVDWEFAERPRAVAQDEVKPVLAMVDLAETVSASSGLRSLPMAA